MTNARTLTLAGETIELWTLDGRFKIVSWDIHGRWVWMEDRNGKRWSYLH